jgi:hypothetical protein
MGEEGSVDCGKHLSGPFGSPLLLFTVNFNLLELKWIGRMHYGWLIKENYFQAIFGFASFQDVRSSFLSI